MASRRFFLPVLVAVALTGGGCVSTQDIAGIQSQLEDIQRQMLQLQKQAPSKQDVENLDAQVARQMTSLLKQEADMQVKLQGVSGQIDELQAKLEDTNYRLGQLSQQIATTNQELKAFRSATPDLGTSTGAPPPGAAGAGPGGTPAPPPQPAPPAVVNDAKVQYDAAYNDYVKGNYDLAKREFEEYLASFPATDLADNATYWIGETYYRQGRFRQAIERFDQVVRNYPRSDKVASALLKKGYAYLELGERSTGIAQLQQVVRQHSSSDEANLARQRLREVGVDAP